MLYPEVNKDKKIPKNKNKGLELNSLSKNVPKTTNKTKGILTRHPISNKL